MVGAFDTRDSWREYWEGTLKRTNDNIGTLTTESVIGIAGYGVTPRLTVTAALPYIHTHASQGVLHDMRGIQDFTVAAKYLLFSTRESARGDLSAFVAGSLALPIGNYSPDFFPLSIGTGGKRAVARATLHYAAPSLWFATASAAYTFCANVAPLETLPPLEPTSTDTSAGSWRMILLSGPTQFAVAAPAATNSPAYQAELAAIKTVQAALTSEQRAPIPYWSGGGVMRWNQILRELVARYNLPPCRSGRARRERVGVGPNG
jgi:hypothetical protein